MAPWILVLQLLLMPFVWASPANNLGVESQLCACEAQVEMAVSVSREKESDRLFAVTMPLAQLPVYVFAPPRVPLQTYSSYPITSKIFLTFESVAYLYRDLFIPPPAHC